MKQAVRYAAVGLTAAVAAIAITAGSQPQSKATAGASAKAAVYDPFKVMTKRLTAISKTDQQVLAELQSLNQTMGSSAGVSSVLGEVQAIHHVVGDSAGIFNILDEVEAINRNTR